jgi:hypothetical protein
VQTASFDSQLQKPLPTGGLAGITFRSDYQHTNQQADLNPIYNPSLAFSFEQPLLQGYGVEINQRASRTRRRPAAGPARESCWPASPSTSRAPSLNAAFRTRLRRRGGVLEPYCSYWVLYSREEGMRQAYQEWLFGYYQFRESDSPSACLDQIEEQYQLFRAERPRGPGNGIGQPGAGGGATVAAGHRAAAGGRLPAGAVRYPDRGPYRPDWKIAVEQAVMLRPELVRARQEVKSAQLALIREQNDLLPDLRVISSYDLTGIGSRLDGRGVDNALRSLASNHFNNWSVGLRMDVPLGFRDANAAVRRARLQLAQRFASLRNQEDQIVFELQRTYRQLIQSIEQVRIQRARGRRRRGRWRLDATSCGPAPEADVTALLLAQRALADALRDEQTAVCEYNIGSAVRAAEGDDPDPRQRRDCRGPVPVCVQQRASENIRRRQAALVLRDRATPALESETPLSHARPTSPSLPHLLDRPRPPEELSRPEASELRPPVQAAPAGRRPVEELPRPEGRSCSHPAADSGCEEGLIAELDGARNGKQDWSAPGPHGSMPVSNAPPTGRDAMTDLDTVIASTQELA